LEEDTKPSHEPSVDSHGVVELLNPRDGGTFQVNGYKLKEYLAFVDPDNVAEKVLLVDPG